MRPWLVVAVCVGGCAGTADPGQPSVEGLTITQHTTTALDAVFVRGDVTLQLEAREFSTGQVTQSYTLGALLVRATTHHGQGIGRIDSNGVALTPSQKSALVALTHALEAELPADTQRVLVEDVVYRTAGYLSTAAAHERIPTFDFKNDHSITYLSRCACSYQYIGCTAGAGCYWRTVGTGNGCVGELPGNGCKGRCGAGCPSDGHSGAYTLDCARHDYQLESWVAASDDFLFAGWNC